MFEQLQVDAGGVSLEQLRQLMALPVFSPDDVEEVGYDACAEVERYRKGRQDFGHSRFSVDVESQKSGCQIGLRLFTHRRLGFGEACCISEIDLEGCNLAWRPDFMSETAGTVAKRKSNPCLSLPAAARRARDA